MLDKRVGKFIAINQSRDNTEIVPILYILLFLFHFLSTSLLGMKFISCLFHLIMYLLGTRFITDDFADFALKKFYH